MNTLPRGLHRRAWGIFTALAEQAKEKSYTKDDAYNDMRWLATFEGWKMKKKRVKIRGIIREWEEPDTMKNKSDAEGMILINTAQCFADERELYIYEYENDINETPYRTVGGRNKEDMKKYIAELKQNGDIEKARILSQVPKKVGRGWKWEDPEEIF